MPVWDDLHKLKDALDRNNVPEREPAGGAKGQEEVRAEMHGETKKVEEIQKKEGWSDRIKGVLDSDDGDTKKRDEELRVKTDAQKAEAKQRIENERGVRDKMHDLIDHGAGKHKLEEAEFARIDAQAEKEKKKASGLRGGLLNALDHLDSDHKSESGRPEAGMKDKVKELFGKQADVEAAKEEGFSDKVNDLLHHGETKDLKKREKQRGWFSGKINEMAGGGAKGELDEDKLDKAIDLFQQHVLKQGAQNNESAIEQLKDEQVAAGIRMAYQNATGHEFPIKKK